MPEPMFAPSTSAKPRATGTIPTATKDMISKTMATAEWASQVSKATVRIEFLRSSVSSEGWCVQWESVPPG